MSLCVQRSGECKESAALEETEVLGEIGRRSGEQGRRVAVAYADLRGKGWIVQSGLNYGADFLLYERGPEEEHAPYAVVVRAARRDAHGSGLCWREGLALNRVAATARKHLVVAFVPADGRPPVRYLHLSRWSPENDRPQTQNL